MVTIFQYVPGWTVPCISPFVTKAIYYMTMAKVPFEIKRQNLQTLDQDSPTGKLPYIVDSDGTKVTDSTRIIQYLKKKYGDPLDADLSPFDAAQMLALNRLIDEHLYWTAVVQIRWRETANWEKYLPIIAGGDVSPGVRAFADDFRFRILNEFMSAGWGRMSAPDVYARAEEDLDAISDFLGEKSFMLGDRPRSIDASVLSILRHIIEAPFNSEVARHGAEKKTLIDYMRRMNQRFGI